ncbi:MAG: hypothetical protein AB7N91_04100 [Candidatus Tectimicrobiota bacterium]
MQSGPGLACWHRIVLAFHLVCIEVGACGMRLVCLFLNLTGLNRFVAASYGAQQQVNCQIAHAMVTYHQDETARLAQDMPPKDRTVTQDETFPGGLCLTRWTLRAISSLWHSPLTAAIKHHGMRAWNPPWHRSTAG